MERYAIDQIVWTEQKPTGAGYFLYLKNDDEHKEMYEEGYVPVDFVHVDLIDIKGDKFLVADSSSWETWFALSEVEEGYWSRMTPQYDLRDD